MRRAVGLFSSFALIATFAAPGLAPARAAAAAPAVAANRSTSTVAAPVTIGSYYSDTGPSASFRAMMNHCGQQTGGSVAVNTIDHETMLDQVGTYLEVNPDNMFTWFAGYRMRTFANQGLVAPMSDVWQNVGASYSDAVKIASTGYDGKQYLLPLETYPWVVMYRKSLFAAKGYAVPTTMSDFMALSVRMRADGLVPLAFGNKDGWPVMAIFDILDMRMNGYDFHMRLLAGDEKWSDPRVKAVFQEWVQLLPYIQTGAVNRTWQQAAQSLFDETAGMFFMGTFAIDATTDAAVKDDIGMFPFPLFGNQYDSENAIDAPIDGLMLSATNRNPGTSGLLECAATPAAQKLLLGADDSVVAAARNADTSSYSVHQTEAYQIIGASNRVAQYFDRDSRPDFAGPYGMQAFFGDFLANPNQDLGALLGSIQGFRDALPPALAAPPLGVKAVSGNASAQVSWKAPASTGGSTITSYTVTASPGGRTCTTTGALSCVVAELYVGTTYTFTVEATNAAGPGPASAPSNSVIPVAVATTFRANSPARILDTRPTAGVVVNIGLSGAFKAGQVRTFKVAGAHYVGGGILVAAVPTWATAVTGNLTIVGETASGVVALGPTMTATGAVTTISFVKGDIRANNVTVGLGPGGTLQAVFRSSTAGATTQLIFDATGYFTPGTSGATYHTVAPGRVLDSRPTTTAHKNIGLAGKFKNKTVRTFTVAGVKALGWSSALVPAEATAVTGNLTVTGSTSDGYVAVGPVMEAVPATSTLNTKAGQNRANGVTVALKAGKLQAVWVGKTGSSADVIFDVTGYFTAGAGGLRFYPITPIRDLDSTTGKGLSGSFTSGTARVLTVAGVPSTAAGISGNLTLLKPGSAGYGFIAPTITGAPTSSTLNSTAGLTVANGFDVALSAGKLSIVWMGTTGSKANFSLDVTGYWK